MKMNPVSKRYCEKVEAILETDDLPAPTSALAFEARALSHPPAELISHGRIVDDAYSADTDFRADYL